LELMTINALMETAIEFPVECNECGIDWIVGEHLDGNLLSYISWLESQLDAALSIGERLLKANLIMGVGNEKSE